MREVTWQGKPITALETSHIERILAAASRGTWSTGAPARVPPFVQSALRTELRKRGSGTYLPPRATRETPRPEVVVGEVEAIPPPDYTAANAAMGYTPPPPPIPAPWSAPAPPPVRSRSRFTSQDEDPIDNLKGTRLIAELQDKVRDLETKLTLAEQNEADAIEAVQAEKRLRERERIRLQRRIDQMGEEAQRRRREEKRADRQAQPRARKLRSLERRAQAADLDSVPEAGLIAWWQEETRDWPELACLGLDRLLAIAARGIDVQQLKPRRLRRPPITREDGA